MSSTAIPGPDRVVIGMDPHKRSATIQVMTVDETVAGGGRFGTDRDGYAAMLRYGKQWPDRVWAIEGCAGIGRHIANRLLVDGEQVVDVPPKLSARARVFATGQGRKTDAYFFGGRIDRLDGYLGGYLGQSGDLNGPRAATSLTRWVVTQRRIIPAGMAILHRDAPYDDRYRRFIEARAIMSLSAGMLWLLNTHTSAGLASANLSRTQVIQGQALATDIADVIRAHPFGGQVNPHPSPAANARGWD